MSNKKKIKEFKNNYNFAALYARVEALEAELKRLKSGEEDKDFEVEEEFYSLCKCCSSSNNINNKHCFNCGNLLQEKQTTNEEQVFELIKDEIRSVFDYENNHTFEEFRHYMIVYQKNIKNIYTNHRKYIFLAIMEGIHKLIEGDKNSYERFIIRLNQYDSSFPQYEISQISTKLKCLPSFFYFSSTENAEKANKILSSFFNIDIRDWWYRA